MIKTVNRRVAIKVAVAYSAELGGEEALAFNLFSETGEEDATTN
jgi:hypothetical protein